MPTTRVGREPRASRRSRSCCRRLWPPRLPVRHRDAIGIPRPRLSFTIGRYVNDGAAEAEVLHERLFTELKATERHHVPFLFGAGHIIGTTKMGDDPATSVTDSFGRCHDVSNMFIAGSSLFPTEGTANPTLTLAALALRTAAAIAH